jgi:tripartite-type tricarboxylate transporter receptor subunit TctC
MKRLLLLLLFVPIMTWAWEPTRTVTVVIGNAPGAGNEIAFRKLSQIINRTNKKITFVVENRAGGDSVIAMNHLMTVLPDGHTIAAFNHMSQYVTQDIWQRDIKRYEYNSFEDVLTIGKSPLVLVAISTSAVNTPDEFVTLLRTTNHPVFVAVGSGAHRITFEYLMMKTSGNRSLVKPILFNGPAQALNSVASTAGGTEFGIMPLAIARPLIEAGKVKPIGITGDRKVAQLPNVPLLRKIAPGINVFAAWNLVLPPKTDRVIVDYYADLFARAINTAEYQEWMDQNLVFVESRELDPDGLRQHAQELRRTFLPLANQINPNE